MRREEEWEGRKDYIFLSVVPTGEHGCFGNGDPHGCCRVVEEVPTHGIVAVGAAPGRVVERAIRVMGSHPAPKRVGLGVGRVVVGRVVAVGGRGRRRRRVHDGDVDGLLGYWMVERGGFGGVDGALHGIGG